MECKIPSISVKHFTKAINCLTKIGDSINFEITPSRFILRTLGQAEAAYFQMNFSTKQGVFFETYDCYYQADINNNNNNNNANENESFGTSVTSEAHRTIKARIKSKIFLSTFRLIEGAHSICLKFDAELNKLDILLTFTYNITRKYTIRFEDIPTILQAEFSPNNEALQELCCPNHIFKRMLHNFENSLQEITLILSEQGLAIKSFIDALDSTSDSISTECHLKCTEFTTFKLNLSSSIKQIILTVVQKEFKAFLTLCEALDEPIQIFITSGGQPILLSNQTPMNLRNNTHHYISSKGIGIKLIMATISDEDQQIALPQRPNQPQRTPTVVTTRSSSHNHNHNHNVRDVRDVNNELLAQPQPSVASASSNRSNLNYNNSDDDDVLIGLPTHGEIDVDQHSEFMPHVPVNTTQNMSVINETEIQNEDNISEHSRTRTRSDYKMLQPHPDSITPPAKGQRIQNENEEDFDVNAPQFYNKNKGKEKRYYDEKNRRIVPSSSESGKTLKQKRRKDIINLVDDNGMNSLELQFTVSDDRNRNNGGNDGLSDYLSSHLDKSGRTHSMTQTQPMTQIAHRFDRDRDRDRDKNRKRRMGQDHYGNENVAKRQKYDENTSYVPSTLRKKPKSKWEPSPDH